MNRYSYISTHLNSKFPMSSTLTLSEALDILDSFKSEVLFGLKTCEFETWIDNECLLQEKRQGDALKRTREGINKVL